MGFVAVRVGHGQNAVVPSHHPNGRARFRLIKSLALSHCDPALASSPFLHPLQLRMGFNYRQVPFARRSLFLVVCENCDLIISHGIRSRNPDLQCNGLVCGVNFVEGLNLRSVGGGAAILQFHPDHVYDWVTCGMSLKFNRPRFKDWRIKARTTPV